MEAFSLLKYWRGGGGANSSANGGNPGAYGKSSKLASGSTTIREMAVDSEEEVEENEFFDLEFALPEDEEGENETTQTEDEEGEEEDGDRDFDFTVSSSSAGSRTDQNLSLSPSDDLFFKGQFLPVEPSSAESHSKLGSLLKPATKLRVLMLGFKKGKSEKVENHSSSPPSGSTGVASKQQNKSFTVKFKVEEVPIVSLFTRENSKSRSRTTSEEVVMAEEKRFAKDVLQKYLRMVKPLYVRVSRRYGEKLGFSGQLSLGKAGATAISTQAQAQAQAQISSPKKVDGEMKEIEVSVVKSGGKQGNLTAGLREVCKHLGKSRSASSAAVAAAPIQSKRQDDSLLQQQDGIQSAILHCKRSFNASRDSDTSNLLSRSTSDPTHEKSKLDSSRTSFDERKVES